MAVTQCESGTGLVSMLFERVALALPVVPGCVTGTAGFETGDVLSALRAKLELAPRESDLTVALLQ